MIRFRRRRLLTAVLAATLAVTCGLAVFFAYRIVTSAPARDVDLAGMRDSVVAQGRKAVATMSSLDHRAAEKGLRAWEASSTGALGDQIRGSEKAIVGAVTRARTTTTATVRRAALIALDPAAGRARIMALVRVTVVPDGGKPTTKNARLLGDLSRVGDRWLLSALAPVPAGA